MLQSKRGSLIEASVNTLGGLVVAMFAQTWYLAWQHIPISAEQNVGLIVFMTVISVLRTYALRRFFNWLLRRISCKSDSSKG